MRMLPFVNIRSKQTDWRRKARAPLSECVFFRVLSHRNSLPDHRVSHTDQRHLQPATMVLQDGYENELTPKSLWQITSELALLVSSKKNLSY